MRLEQEGAGQRCAGPSKEPWLSHEFALICMGMVRISSQYRPAQATTTIHAIHTRIVPSWEEQRRAATQGRIGGRFF
jgi:hypothetical protein